MDEANNAALIAPSSPMANVPTGIPLGICAMDNKLSNPFNFLLSIGELFMSPVGLSKITDLSPKRMVAFMMGVWFLSSAYAFQLVGFIGKQLAIESEDINVGGMDTLNIYIGGFDLISKYAIGAGIIVLLTAPLLKKLMGNIH